jgi:oxygen-independent coproporphyrinogen-3 oxidase
LVEAISLYIHVPFCTKKCPYCHFFVVPDAHSSHTLFLESLKKEWQLLQPLINGKHIVSVYLGGGTPSLLGPQAIQEILSWIECKGEITLEVNPDGVTLEKMAAFKAAGVNRVSLGIQSLDNPLLKTLGRLHSAQKAMEAVHLTSKAGISNITIDLMYEIPGQTLKIWQETLDLLKQLPITHLSLYNLTFEPGAVFYKKKKELSPLLPSPEESLAMLHAACGALHNLGLIRYEISAFAKPGHESKHNTGYWTGRPFLGLGPSAFSFWEGRRFRNVCHLKKWHAMLASGKLPSDFEEKLSPEASAHERLAVRLRMLEGVPFSEMPTTPLLAQILERLQSKGWIEQTESAFRLTEEGLLFYDSVAEEIIL